jgi:hypothetical protein
MTARVNKVAVPKLAILKLVVINNYPFPVVLLILHHLNLIGTARLLIV